MALVLRSIYSRSQIRLFDLSNTIRFDFLRCSSASHEPKIGKDDPQEFRTLELYPRKKVQEKKKTKSTELYSSPRVLEMNSSMDWTNIWPGPRTFHPAVVPLPIRQGRNKRGPPPGKLGNSELMKIPNFLHLTPPAIEKHCNAIKQFCTKWPENLKTDEDIEKHFPVEIISSDYCHSSCSIREPKARVISLRVKLKHLELDEHAKDKFFRIVGARYNPSTDYVTITTDSCPLKKQNYEYTYYLLTAVYFESWKFEEWEKEKSDDDMEKYIFSQRKSYKNVKTVFNYNKKELPELEEFSKSAEDFYNVGDDLDVISKYKTAAMKLLSIPPLEA